MSAMSRYLVDVALLLLALFGVGCASVGSTKLKLFSWSENGALLSYEREGSFVLGRGHVVWDESGQVRMMLTDIKLVSAIEALSPAVVAGALTSSVPAPLPELEVSTSHEKRTLSSRRRGPFEEVP